MGSSSEICDTCRFFKEFSAQLTGLADEKLQFGFCIWYFQPTATDEVGYRKGQSIKRTTRIDPASIRLFEVISKNKDLRKLQNNLYKISDWSDPDIMRLGNILTQKIHIPITYRFYKCKWYG